MAKILPQSGEPLLITEIFDRLATDAASLDGKSIRVIGRFACCRMTNADSVIEEGRKTGNILFNDALNTFYLRLYGVRHMVKDHSDSEKGNPLPPHRLLFPISSKGSFICTIPQI